MPSDIRTALGLESQELLDTEIQEFLDSANRIVIAEAGKHQIDVFRGQKGSEFELAFKPLLSVDAVFKNDTKLTENTDYTVDLTNGKITLTNEISEFDILRVWYVPAVYKDLERAIACTQILQRGVIHTDGNIINTQIQVWKEYENSLRNILRKKAYIGSSPDHYRNPYLW